MASNIQGKNIMLYYQEAPSITYPSGRDIPFACSTNCTFNVQVGQKEVTSQTSAWYSEYKIDIASWSINCDGLVTLTGFNYLNFLNIQQNRTPIQIKFVIDNAADGLVIISGTCNLSNFQINAPFKDIGTYSVSLQGTGAYGTTGTSVTPGGTIIIAGGAVYEKEYVATGGQTTITWTDMIGKICLYVSRGGADVRQIVASGATGEQVAWNSATGVLTFPRALAADEFVRGLFQ
jgi:hypothetical protein